MSEEQIHRILERLDMLEKSFESRFKDMSNTFIGRNDFESTMNKVYLEVDRLKAKDGGVDEAVRELRQEVKDSFNKMFWWMFATFGATIVTALSTAIAKLVFA